MKRLASHTRRSVAANLHPDANTGSLIASNGAKEVLLGEGCGLLDETTGVFDGIFCVCDGTDGVLGEVGRVYDGTNCVYDRSDRVYDASDCVYDDADCVYGGAGGVYGEADCV